jgi:hypothetical protein
LSLSAATTRAGVATNTSGRTPSTARCVHHLPTTASTLSALSLSHRPGGGFARGGVIGAWSAVKADLWPPQPALCGGLGLGALGRPWHGKRLWARAAWRGGEGVEPGEAREGAEGGEGSEGFHVRAHLTAPAPPHAAARSCTRCRCVPFAQRWAACA